MVTNLTQDLEVMQARNEQLAAVLAAVTRQWRAIAAHNCVLQADLSLALALR